MKWLFDHIQSIDGFPRPDWDSIQEFIDKVYSDAQQSKIWDDVIKAWVTEIKGSLSGSYRGYETDNFLLLTKGDKKYTSLLATFLESSRKRLLKTLRGIASDDGFGKHVVLLIDDVDKYYSYISHYYPDEGHFGGSSGCFINQGYRHFVFIHQNLENAQAVAAHELTHALVSHLPIPAWINEGLAVNSEIMLMGYGSQLMEREIYNEHKAYWGEDEIQKFWSGEAFFLPDQGQRFSYELAQYTVQTLATNISTFREFVNFANFGDGGEKASKEVYGASLGVLIGQFFGEGNWSPKPEEWSV